MDSTNGIQNQFQSRGKDNNLIDTAFDFGFIDELKSHTGQVIKQGQEAAELRANKFPVDAFPKPFHDFVIECSNALNFPTDYTGTAIIAAVATVIGKSAKVKVKTGWYELPGFYLALIGDPGAAKSHAMELPFKVFADIDREAIKQFDKDYSEYEAFQALSKKDKENQSKPVKPVLIKSILNNFTPEILPQRLADNPYCCTIVSDELATFLEGMNNYSKGDQTAVYLSFWSNKPTSIDRVSKPVPLWLQEPLLNIIGSLQPRVLPKLFPTGKTDNGFLQRFLFAYPQNAEKQPINDVEIDENLLSKYGEWIKEYRLSNPIHIDSETEKPKPKIYHWTPEAKDFFYQWQKENTDKVNDNADGLKGEIFSKFDIHFVRLSLVLQVMLNYTSNEISLKAVQGAEKLSTYFQRNAMKVLDILESGMPSAGLTQNKIDFYNSLRDHFTTGEANAIGHGLEFNVKAVQRFLNNENLFVRTAQGQYSKKVKKQLS